MFDFTCKAQQKKNHTNKKTVKIRENDHEVKHLASVLSAQGVRNWVHKDSFIL